MSSHREAPAISMDPVADSTDVYAFRDPVDPSLVTIICNYIPFQAPDGGPNFYEFGGYNPSSPFIPAAKNPAPVVYDININNDGTGLPNITYRFTFNVTIPNDATFLYADYPITASTKTPPYNLSPNGFNRPQSYTITKIVNGELPGTSLAPSGGASALYCPPCNVGPRTTPDYPSLSAAGLYTLESGEKVFAGQRADAFWVDLGAIFDLGDLRPLSPDQLLPGPSTNGINSLGDTNVHSIAIQVPIAMLTSGAPASAAGTIGVWTAALRPPIRIQNITGSYIYSGSPVQVSRLGNPLVNEVVVPMAFKDYFNSQPPAKDIQFAKQVEAPELQSRLVELYAKAFPNLAAFIKAGGLRKDLVAIFATGIPDGLIKGFPGTYQGGKSVSEMLRLNTTIDPVKPGDTGYSSMGLLGGDIGGFPNGRRVGDDVVTIELTAVAGATIPLVDPSYKVDAAVGATTDTHDAPVKGVNEESPFNPNAVQTGFPYLADPYAGFSNPTGTPANGASSVNFVPTTTSN